MDFEVEPRRVTRRSSASGFAVAALIVLVLAGIVVLTNGSRPGPAVGPSPVARVVGAAPTPMPMPTPTPTPAPPFLPSPFPSSLVRPAPPTVQCHAIDADRCLLVANAAVDAARDPYLPPASVVEVWASLICGSTLDCPPNQLVGLRPLGSATIRYASSAIVLWVNVGEVIDRSSPSPTAGPRTSGQAPVADPIAHLDAWVLRQRP
jgi:hypothetical protein